MHKNVISKKYCAKLLASLSIAATALIASPLIHTASASPAEGFSSSYGDVSSSESRESGIIKVGDDDHRRHERTDYDYRDGRANHETREHYQREHDYSHDNGDRARQDYSHHEHEEHEHHNQYGH
jgi:hypothetical protein